MPQKLAKQKKELNLVPYFKQFYQLLNYTPQCNSNNLP